jgi:hypothetical protein
MALIGSAGSEVFLGAEGVAAYFTSVREHDVTVSFAWKDAERGIGRGIRPRA